MKKLDRELGLFSVFAISTGAMLGPGIFVLPGLAYTIGGPAVILAYTVAGLLVIPAALNMAEMSTALPESGGPYLFLDRSLGPLAGTLTGLGTWISLILKSAFSLIGLGAYLLFFSGLPNSFALEVALGIGIFLIALNAFGAKKAGQVQTVLVLVTMFVLVDFVGWGSIEVLRDHYHPFFQQQMMGFLGATAFVFVSYAGIAKVVSVAEEIKDPSRNIPWGISLSLVVMILIYALVVYVIVGVVPTEELGHGPYKLMPLVQAGEELGGYWGMEIMAGIAVLALASMANAGLMAASRFPLPLARDRILPKVLSKISPSFSTPFISILLTGTIMILFISLLPVKSLAKLASAFLLIVFGLINLAVIVFRESEIEWYEPDFCAPLYPFLQIFGFLACASLIFFMGVFPLMGASALIGGCLLWYYGYARSRVDRKGAFFRRVAEEDEIEIFERERSRSRRPGESVIVPFFGLKDKDMLEVERRIRLAAALCDDNKQLDVVDLVEVPEQSFLSGFDPEPESFEALEKRVEMLRNEISNEIHLDQVVTHSSRGALRNYAEQEQPYWVVFDWQEPSTWSVLIGTWTWWLEDFPCDTLFFKDRGKPELQDIVVLTQPGPFDGEVVYAADHIARHFGGEVTFMNPLIEYSREALESVDSYQEELQLLCEAPSSARSVSPDEWIDAVLERTSEADLLIVGGLTDESYENFNAKTQANHIIEQTDCSVARVRSNIRSPQSVLEDYVQFEGPLEDYVPEDGPLASRISADDKDELFRRIAEDLAPADVEPDVVEEALWKREQKQNTYCSEGIGLPHGFVDSMDSTYAKLYVLDESVEYDTQENEVLIVAATVGPSSKRAEHLNIIGQFSRKLVNASARQDLLDQEDPEAVAQKIFEIRTG